MKPSKYYVLDEHTLGFISEADPTHFQVLHGSVLLGGYDWKNGPVPLSPNQNLRPATLEDFDFYCVSPKGHIA